MNRYDQIREMLENEPNDPFLLFALAKEYEKKDLWPEARQTYSKLLDSDSDYVGAYYHLAKAYEQANEFQQALEIYTKGIEIAKEQRDMLSLSELSSAKENLELELEE